MGEKVNGFDHDQYLKEFLCLTRQHKLKFNYDKVKDKTPELAFPVNFHSK